MTDPGIEAAVRAYWGAPMNVDDRTKRIEDSKMAAAVAAWLAEQPTIRWCEIHYATTPEPDAPCLMAPRGLGVEASCSIVVRPFPQETSEVV